MTATGNRLLAAMNPDDLVLLTGSLERIPLSAGAVLADSNQTIEHAYFPDEGLISLVTTNFTGERIEVAHVGREGLAGTELLFGVSRSMNQMIVQLDGSAARIAAHDLEKAIESSSRMRFLLLRYTHTLLAQIAHSALANGRYSVKARLARWLLMCHDRSAEDSMAVTHETLALMLGVRRAGVTEGLHLLEGSGAIRSMRRRIVVVDRATLEEQAGGSYGVPESAYAALLGNGGDNRAATKTRTWRDAPEVEVTRSA